MMSGVGFSVAVSVVVLALVSAVEGGVLFSTLNRTLTVSAKVQEMNLTSGVAEVGKNHLVVEWALNSTFVDANVDEKYKAVKLRLCYAPASQTDRSWRKTKDDLHKDKTCTHGIAVQKYDARGNSTVWRIAKDVPGAIYFVRAYAVDAEGTQLAFGQTTDKAKTTNLITIVPISGRLVSLDIASAVFSIFSIGSLVSFLTLEAVRAKKRRAAK